MEQSSFTLLLWLCGVIVTQASFNLMVTVNYCDKSGNGHLAIVDVNDGSQFTVVKQFSGGIPCSNGPVAPAHAFDLFSQTSLFSWYYQKQFELVNYTSMAFSSHAESQPSWQAMAINSGLNIYGVVGGITGPNCQNSCYQFGSATMSGVYTPIALLPFRGDAYTATPAFSASLNTFYVQLNKGVQSNTCDQGGKTGGFCLLTIEATTGAIQYDVKTPNQLLWLSAPSIWDSDVYILGVGYPSGRQCLAGPNQQNSWAVYNTSTTTGHQQFVTCLSNKVDAYLKGGQFTFDNAYFVAYAWSSQNIPWVLAFDTSNGQIVLNTTLAGLGPKLGVTEMTVWAVDPTSASDVLL